MDPTLISYICLLRCLPDWPMWHDDAAVKLLVYCLIRASYKTRVLYGVTLAPGQLILSKKAATNELGWSRNKLRRHLSQLVEAGVLLVSEVAACTVVTIRKPSHYLHAFGDSMNTEIPPWARDESTACPEDTLQVTKGSTVDPGGSTMNPGGVHHGPQGGSPWTSGGAIMDPKQEKGKKEKQNGRSEISDGKSSSYGTGKTKYSFLHDGNV